MKIYPLVFIVALSLQKVFIELKNQKKEPKRHGRVLEESLSNDRFDFSTETHNEHYKRIKEDIKGIEASYIECLDNLADLDYSEDSVNGCVGKDLIFVVNDISYERKKIIGRADKKIRDYIMEYCYKLAGMNEAQSTGCDALERDVLDLLWAELNIETTIDYHRHKYLFTFGEIPEENFEKILLYLKNLYSELSELITEIDHHEQLTNANIKTTINRRTKHLLERARENIKNPLPKIYKHFIEIHEKINEPSKVHVDNLPRPVTMNSSSKLYEGHGNPYVEEFHEKTGYKYTRTGEDNSIRANHYGPIITIPDRKLKKTNSKRLEQSRKKSQGK